MKSNKDENEPLEIEIEAKMKEIKAICCIIFYIDNIYFVCTEISLKNFFRFYDTIWVLTLEYENNSL